MLLEFWLFLFGEYLGVSITALVVQVHYHACVVGQRGNPSQPNLYPRRRQGIPLIHLFHPDKIPIEHIDNTDQQHSRFVDDGNNIQVFFAVGSLGTQIDHEDYFVANDCVADLRELVKISTDNSQDVPSNEQYWIVALSTSVRLELLTKILKFTGTDDIVDYVGQEDDQAEDGEQPTDNQRCRPVLPDQQVSTLHSKTHAHQVNWKE